MSFMRFSILYMSKRCPADHGHYGGHQNQYAPGHRMARWYFIEQKIGEHNPVYRLEAGDDGCQLGTHGGQTADEQGMGQRRTDNTQNDQQAEYRPLLSRGQT